jgi:hypothetical protein
MLHNFICTRKVEIKLILKAKKMDFKKRIIEELKLSELQANTLLKNYISTCEKLAKEYYSEQFSLYGVGNWVRFEDNKPKLNDLYLIVWDNYPPETRTWQKEDEDKDFAGLRWLAIPKWK